LSEYVIATSLACVLYHRAHACHSLGLSCVDAPLISSTMAVAKLGADRVFVRKLWRRIGEVVRKYGDELLLFEKDGVRLSVRLEVGTGKVYVIKGIDFIVGERDCVRRRDCAVVSRTKSLYAYANFHIGKHFALSLNTLYLFKLLLDLGHRRIVDEIFDLTFNTIDLYVNPSGRIDVDGVREELERLASDILSRSAILQSLSLGVRNLLHYVVPIRRILSRGAVEA